MPPSTPARAPGSASALALPPKVPDHLGRVRRYLLQERRLPPPAVDPLIDAGVLYADRRANAVFLLLGKENQPVGAELRGTGPVSWRGMAPGSRKDLGCFAIPATRQPQSTTTRDTCVLCESAVDALSCHALHPTYRCLSTAGARPNPAWLPDLLAQGAALYCGFDLDDTGQAMAQAMIALHPSIHRLRPSRKDWNDVLCAEG